MGDKHTVLDDNVTPADFQTVSEVLDGMSELRDTFAVLTALGHCGVVIPDGESALQLLCRAEAVSTGIDGVWPMTENDFLKIFSSVRRKQEVRVDNLCDTPEAGYFLMSLSAERDRDDTDSLAGYGSSHFGGNAGQSMRRRTGTGGLNSSRGSVIAASTSTPHHKPLGTSSHRSRHSTVGAARNAASSPTPSMRRRTVQVAATHDHATTADGDSVSVATGVSPSPMGAGSSMVGLRRAQRSMRLKMQELEDSEKNEMLHAIQAAIAEMRLQRASERVAAAKARGDDTPEDAALIVGSSQRATTGSVLGSSTLIATPLNGGNVSIRELGEVCARFGVDPSSFERFAAEKQKLTQLMSFAKPKAQRFHDQLTSAGATPPDADADVGNNNSSNGHAPIVKPGVTIVDVAEEFTLCETEANLSISPTNNNAAGGAGEAASSSASPLVRGMSFIPMTQSFSGSPRDRVPTSAMSSVQGSRKMPRVPNVSVSVLEISQWLAKPQSNDANTPRASQRARKRWQRALDAVMAKNRSARGAWADLSSNIRRLVAAKRAAAAGGVALANFDLAYDPETILKKLDESVNNLHERTVRKRVDLKLAPAIERADAIVESMSHVGGNQELMLRQICTPCYGASRACEMAKQLRAWREGPKADRRASISPEGSEGCSPSVGSRSPGVAESLGVPSQDRRASTQSTGSRSTPAWKQSGAPHFVAFSPFDVDPNEGKEEGDGVAFGVAVDGATPGDLSVKSSRVTSRAQSPCGSDDTVSGKATATPVPSSQTDPPAVTPKQLDRWTTSNSTSGPENAAAARPGSAAAARKAKRGQAGARGGASTPSLGPEAGPTRGRSMSLLKTMVANSRARAQYAAEDAQRYPPAPRASTPAATTSGGANTLMRPLPQPAPSPLLKAVHNASKPRLRQPTPELSPTVRRPLSAASREAAW